MLKDFVLESCNAPGTATTINLAGPAADRLSFAAVFTNGSPVFYYMDDSIQAEWGIGTLTTGSPNTLTRSTVLGNTSNTTARLNFTGTVRVYNELPAARAPYVDNTNTLALPPGCRVSTLAGGLPIGIMMVWPTATAPAGWLLCGGQAVSRTTYNLLFSVVGGTYGAGDGSTTYNLPDLRSRTVIGKDDMGGTVSNRINGVVGANASTLGYGGGDQWLMQHNHVLSLSDPGHAHAIADPGHAHSVADSGHAHALNGPAQLGGGYAGYAAPSTGVISINNVNWSTDTRGANIGIYAAATGIGIYGATTGITGSVGYSGAGGWQNLQPFLTLSYIIYAAV